MPANESILASETHGHHTSKSFSMRVGVASDGVGGVKEKFSMTPHVSLELLLYLFVTFRLNQNPSAEVPRNSVFTACERCDNKFTSKNHPTCNCDVKLQCTSFAQPHL